MSKSPNKEKYTLIIFTFPDPEIGLMTTFNCK